VPLALEIRKHAALRFAGLQAYHGKAQHLRTAQERRAAIGIAVDDVVFTRKLIEAQGVPVDLVTGAGTGTWCWRPPAASMASCRRARSCSWTRITRKTKRDPAQPHFEHALFVKTQVISTCATHAVCDAGTRAMPLIRACRACMRLTRAARWTTSMAATNTAFLRTAASGQRLPGPGPLPVAHPRPLRPHGQPAQLHDRRDGWPAQRPVERSSGLTPEAR
jgi:hypothetical protein